jgi:acid phosphatase type 7
MVRRMREERQAGGTRATASRSCSRGSIPWRVGMVAALVGIAITVLPGTSQAGEAKTMNSASDLHHSTISLRNARFREHARILARSQVARARLRIKPKRASVGTKVKLVGTRFPAKRRVRIAFGRIRLKGGRTTKRGSFSKRFRVPSVKHGSYRIRVRAGRRRASVVFIVRPDPLIAAAGDIACDPERPDFNRGLGTAHACHMRQTSDLILKLRPRVVLALGDTQYEAGTPPDFRASYNPTWGRFKEITRPIIGNHEYGHQSGAGYFDYFGARAGPRPQGYYSFNVGTWHLIALNSNCDRPGVSCGEGSAQEQWLRADLAANRRKCVLAYIHTPFFSTTTAAAADPRTLAFFNALYGADADVVLAASHHHYERLAPQAPGAVADPARGIRQFVVGTGGRDLRPFGDPVAPNSEVRNADTFGVLTLRMHPSSYDWRFVPESGRSFSDAGSQACH